MDYCLCLYFQKSLAREAGCFPNSFMNKSFVFVRFKGSGAVMCNNHINLALFPRAACCALMKPACRHGVHEHLPRWSVLLLGLGQGLWLEGVLAGEPQSCPSSQKRWRSVRLF